MNNLTFNSTPNTYAKQILIEAYNIGFDIPWDDINTRAEAIEHAKVAQHFLDDRDAAFIKSHSYLDELAEAFYQYTETLGG